MKSDTPKTDAVWADKNQNILEHARQLEQELNEATRHIGELEEELDRLRLANLELTQTLNHRCERGIRD